MGNVTKHAAIMESDGDVIVYETGAGHEYEGVEFLHQDHMEENPDDVAPSQSSNRYVMGVDLWKAMGSPTIITLTAVPGDALNE